MQSSLSSAWMMSSVSACYLVTLLKWLNIGNIFLMSLWFWFLLTVSYENRIISPVGATGNSNWKLVWIFESEGKDTRKTYLMKASGKNWSCDHRNANGMLLPATRAFWWIGSLIYLFTWSVLLTLWAQRCSVFTRCRKLRIWLVGWAKQSVLIGGMRKKSVLIGARASRTSALLCSVLCKTIGSLNENVIWKCNYAFL